MNYETLKKELAEHEGYVNEIYLDHLGYATVGIGHLILKTDIEYTQPLGTKVSAKRINDLFTQDVNNAVKDCKKLFSNFDTCSDNVQHILINMMFNLGLTRFSKFKLFKAAIEIRDWKVASFEGKNSLWYKQVPRRAEVLMDRLYNE